MKKRTGASRPVLVGDTYLDERAGRLVRVVDHVPAAGQPATAVVVEALDPVYPERWWCSPDRLIPASAGVSSAALLAIAHRLLDRGERLLRVGDRRSADGAFASASLALEILVGEVRLRIADGIDRIDSQEGRAP